MDLFDDLPAPTAKATNFIVNKDYVSHENANDTSICVALKRSNSDVASVDECSKIKKTCLTNVIPLISSIFALKGERDEMQDAHVVLDDFKSFCADRNDEPSPLLVASSTLGSTGATLDDVQRISFYAIYDGHGGVRAAQFASAHLHRKLSQRIPRINFSQFEKDVKRIFIDVYKETDAEFLKIASKERPHWKDGSTASTVLIIDNTLYVANIGDSKVVLGRESETIGVGGSTIQAICLTVDHNPQDYEERQRIQRTGSVVRDGRVSGILEVSRSFGDYQFKKQGVSCVPDVRKCSLTDKDRFLIIGCDGLWKSLSATDAISLCAKIIPARHAELTQTEWQAKVDEACCTLVNEAVLKLSGDNVSVILIALNYFVNN